jgi:hypothetical protein
MKKYVGAVIAAVFGFVIASCAETGLGGGGGDNNNPSLPPNGTPVPGFARFHAGGGTLFNGMFKEGGTTDSKKYVDVPFVLTDKMPIIVNYYGVIDDKPLDNEAAFLEALETFDAANDWAEYGYDYVNDPLKLKVEIEEDGSFTPLDQKPFFTANGERYKITLEKKKSGDDWIDIFTNPISSGKIFASWKVDATLTPIKNIGSGNDYDYASDPFDTSAWFIILD